VQLLLKNEVTTQRSNEVAKKGRRKRRTFSFAGEFLGWGFERPARLAGGGDVAAEDTEFARGFADFGEGSIEAGDVGGFYVDEKLIFPGAAVDGAAFDLKEIDAVFGEWFKRGEERARAVGETHG